MAAVPKPRESASLTDANTLHLPCTAAALCEFAGADELRAALAWAQAHDLEPLVLGEGSNVILPPQLPRAVLRSSDRELQVVKEDVNAVELRVGAGMNWHALVTECLQRGWHGLENLALIPGSVGAAPVQNIGAYGVELAQFVSAVHGVELASGEEGTLDSAECAFAYRDSIFKGALAGAFAITAVDLRLSRGQLVNSSYPALAKRLRDVGGKITPHAVFDTVVALRRERLPDPARDPNAGSFFKNPVVPRAQAAALREAHPALPVYPVAAGGYGEPGAEERSGREAHAAEEEMVKLSAAWLIDACGFKGREGDGVAVSARHALVLVHRGGGQDRLLALADDIRAAVESRFAVRLELEPTVYRDG
jgi:UDP-N-acetylmuramate dehydrogenase